MKRSRRDRARRNAPPRPGPVVPTAPAWVWPALIPLALAALLWSVRGAPLGTPVADDYAFLARLQFQQPLDPFDSMGASFYWRPLSRQLYFALVGPWLVAAPWGAAVLHALLLAATAALLYRASRRVTSAPVASAVALAPLLTEGARVLLDWPSAGQHVLAMGFAVLALDRALARDRIGAPLAALAALLSHEATFPILLVLPAAAGLAARSGREAARFGALAAAVAIAWAAGYAVAIQHGVALPPGAIGGKLAAGWPLAGGLAVGSALNLEDLDLALLTALAFAYAALGLAALVLVVRPAARHELRRALPVIALGLAWFALGVTPLGALLPDWNAWRATLPVLGLVIAATVFLAAVHPGLALGFAALRLAALLAAPVAPATVEMAPPHTVSDFSLPRLVRLQRIVDAARRALEARHVTLPVRGVVRYWSMPQLAEVGFHGPDAVRVWYADSTLAWAQVGGLAGLHQQRDALVEFDNLRASLATALDPGAVQLYVQALDAALARRFLEADSLLLAAEDAQVPRSGPFLVSIAHNRALIAMAHGDVERADSLNRIDIELAGESPGNLTVEAWVAFRRNQMDAGRRALMRALKIAPQDELAQELAKEYLQPAQ